MPLKTLFFVSHGLCFALGSALCTMLAGGVEQTAFVYAVGTAGAAGLAAWLLGTNITKNLARVEGAFVGRQAGTPPATTIREFNDAAARAVENASRWRDGFAQSRQRWQELRALLRQVDESAAELSEDRLISHLERLLAELSRSVEGDLERVVEYARGLEQSAQQIGATADDQTDAVNKAANYVEQISANINTVTQSADAAQRLAAAAQTCATDGGKFIRDLIAGMDRMRLHVEAGEKQVRTLAERTEEINSIVETIGSISDRTDMLALNASIESLRAGENGRGFALVADEVRKLAEQVAQATQEISELIDSVQRETQESIALMVDGRTRVEDESRRAQAAGEALEQIGATSRETTECSAEIIQAMQRQLGLARDVCSSMEAVASNAKSTRTRAEGVRRDTATLTTLTGAFEDSLNPLRRLAGQHNPRSRGTTALRDAARVQFAPPQTAEFKTETPDNFGGGDTMSPLNDTVPQQHAGIGALTGQTVAEHV